MSKKKATSISLPMSRTMKIMTSAVGVESVNQDAVAIATKATEIFLTDFARRAYELSDSNILDYDDITRLVHSDPRYDFIVDTTPKRIKFSEALKLIEQSKEGEPNLDEPENQPEQISTTTPKAKAKTKTKTTNHDANEKEEEDDHEQEEGEEEEEGEDHDGDNENQNGIEDANENENDLEGYN
uniref:Chromatin accessibility complex protein 1 n=1 Tax=Aceria tosichella TaxID=561515 RepID=A0A6G1S9X0_9ACAR